MPIVTGTNNPETLNGSNADDQIYGLGANDTLNGFDGHDLLDGGLGADTMVGGSGDDSYWIDDTGDAIVESTGQGFDIAYAMASYILSAGASVEVLATINNLATTSLNLTGNELDNYVVGNAGVNTLDGGAGGLDVLWGREGSDSYFVDGDDAVVEYAGHGYDIVYARASHALTAGYEIEVLATVDNTATTALNLTGNELDNYIVGNAGVNTLDGGSGGSDQLWGREGDDSYFVDTNDVVVEYAGQGYDVVYARNSFVLGVGVYAEVLATINEAATTALNLTGNELDNYITGNAGDNVIDGGGGSDTLWGRAGDDSYYADGNDIVLEYAGQGYDVIYARADYTLVTGGFVEKLGTVDNFATTAINLTGNELDNYITGNAGSNTINGGTGSDTLWGREGDDSYFVESNDVVLEYAGQGYDIIYARGTFTLGVGVSVEVIGTENNFATTSIALTGNELANLVSGNAGANYLDGGAGADSLHGRGGADTFAFTTALGGGNVDTIQDFSAADDTISLGGGAGEPFALLASGTLAAASFVVGTGALDANDYLIYNSGTGALLYDADGSGGGAAIQFATLSAGLSLTAADFVVTGPANSFPVITSGATASVVENSPVSTIVYQVQANDADGDRITYSLTGADASLLTIDANGAVRLLASPDYESRTIYNFNVVASDSGASTTKAVALGVVDVNEGGPPTPIINETAAANDSSGTAQFIDRNQLIVATNANLPNDDLPSATVQGSISGNNDRDYYSITLQQGELLILDVDFTDGGLDSHVFVLGPSGTPLGDNDDQGTFDAGSTGIATTHNTDSYFQFRAPAAGTYYFYIQSFEGTSMGNYKINVSIGPTASAALIFEEDVSALISGAQWNRTNLTYGFPQSADQYPTQFDELSTNGSNEFQPFSANQQVATRLLIQLVQNVSGLTFTELVANAGQADLRYAMSTDDDVEAAHAYYPTNVGPTSAGGTSWYNTTSFNAPLKGNYAWMGILHETGHALGLEHGHEDAPTVSPGHDSLEYTVMTYRSYIGDPLSGGYSNETFGFPQTLMMLDIAALQKIYGANFAFNSGDSVYSWNAGTGEMSINGAGQGAPGNGAGGTQNRVFLTIWDGGGTDAYDMSNYSSAVTIDLRPGEWSITSQVQLAGLGDGNTARGNVANALQYLGNEASLIENAVGGAGNDSLTANEATNRLTGNGGADTFKWLSRADGGDLGGAADVVADFLRGTDKIDLSGVDANAGTGSDDAFAFIGADAFHNVAGELRYQVEGANLRIMGDTDGNGISDFEVIVSNNTILANSDFIF